MTFLLEFTLSVAHFAAVGVSIALFNQVSRIAIFPLVSVTTSFIETGRCYWKCEPWSTRFWTLGNRFNYEWGRQRIDSKKWYTFLFFSLLFHSLSIFNDKTSVFIFLNLRYFLLFIHYLSWCSKLYWSLQIFSIRYMWECIQVTTKWWELFTILVN